jgi:hypothetical protein
VAPTLLSPPFMMRAGFSFMMIGFLVTSSASAAKEKGERQKGKRSSTTAPAAKVEKPIVNVAHSPVKLIGAPKAKALKLVPAAPAPKGRMELGKDESTDVAEHQQADYRAWRGKVSQEIVTEKGQKLPVAIVEIGPPDVEKPTIVHFHGASVQPENVLLWRLARAFEEVGKPVRIIAPSYRNGDEVLKEVTRTYGKVAVSGHSAGSGQAASMAQRYPDMVTHYIGMGGPSSAGATPTLLFQGSNDGGGYLSSFKGNKAVTALNLDGVDHSMRSAPGNTSPGPEKQKYNATPETAKVARGVATTMLEFVSGKPVGERGFLSGLKSNVETVAFQK